MLYSCRATRRRKNTRQTLDTPNNLHQYVQITCPNLEVWSFRKRPCYGSMRPCMNKHAKWLPNCISLYGNPANWDYWLGAGVGPRFQPTQLGPKMVQKLCLFVLKSYQLGPLAGDRIWTQIPARTQLGPKMVPKLHFFVSKSYQLAPVAGGQIWTHIAARTQLALKGFQNNACAN